MTNTSKGISGVLNFNDGNNTLMYNINNFGNDVFMKIDLDGIKAELDGFDIYNLGEACKEAIKYIKKTKITKLQDCEQK